MTHRVAGFAQHRHTPRLVPAGTWQRALPWLLLAVVATFVLLPDDQRVLVLSLALGAGGLLGLVVSAIAWLRAFSRRAVVWEIRFEPTRG